MSHDFKNNNGNMVSVPRHSPIMESTLKMILEQAEIPVTIS